MLPVCCCFSSGKWWCFYLPYLNSCKNLLCTFPFFFIPPHFAFSYPSCSLFIVTDHSTFEILLAFLFFYSLSASEDPEDGSRKAKACVAGGQMLLVQIYSFACECAHLHTNTFIHRNKRIFSVCTICANKNWIHETTQKSRGEVRSPAIFTSVACSHSDNTPLKR